MNNLLDIVVNESKIRRTCEAAGHNDEAFIQGAMFGAIIGMGTMGFAVNQMMSSVNEFMPETAADAIGALGKVAEEEEAELKAEYEAQ